MADSRAAICGRRSERTLNATATPSGPLVRLRAMQQPLGGLFGFSTEIRNPLSVPAFLTTIVGSGDAGWVTRDSAPTASWRATALSPCSDQERDATTGSDVSFAEALERYCASVAWKGASSGPRPRRLATTPFLLESLPVCSPRELSAPGCPLIAPVRDEPIRWAVARSLLPDRQVYVPAVLAYLGLPRIARAERIAIPNSSGCAAHEDYQRAVLAALCEVVERDAVAVTWLQRLSLPES